MKVRRACVVTAVFLAAGVVAWCELAAAPGAVAIFNDPDFPYFCAPASLTGPDMQAWFAAVGLRAELLDAQALADPERFNADRYPVLIHLYGNTFPRPAAENLRRFHQAGGGIVAAGVPFCHPCEWVGAAGWQWVVGRLDAGERAAEAAHAGGYGLRITKGGPNWSGVQQAERLPAKPGETFTVAGWVKTAGAAGNSGNDALMLRFWDGAGTFLGQVGPALPREASEWTSISREVTTPPGTAAVDVLLAFWVAPATVWLDDVVLVRGALAGRPENAEVEGNLLPNASFEEGGGWKDLGHVPWFGHDRIGTGSFAAPEARGTALVYRGEADPLRIGVLGWPRWRRLWEAGLVPFCQTLDPRSLPAEDQVVPVVEVHDARGAWPVIAAIRHNCAEFRGAVDVWGGTQLFTAGDTDAVLGQREVLGRAALYVLRQRGAGFDYDGALRRADGVYRAALPPRELTPPAERRPFAGVFPKSRAPAPKIWVADISRLPLDEKLAILSVQGVVNARRPRVYCVVDPSGADGGKPPVDERWLAWLQERGDTAAAERLEDPWELLRLCRDEIKGAVVTDADLPASVNVGTMLCGLEGAVLLSPRLAGRHDLPLIADLRGRWQRNARAYEWAIRNLWPRLNPFVLGIVPPDCVAPRDYLIAHKAFCFWVTGPKDARPPVGSPLEERLVIAKLLAQAPANVGVLGAPYAGEGYGIQEGPGVMLLSQYAKFLAWSSETANLSLHSGTRPPSFARAAPPAPELDRSKAYVTLLVSDGDAPVNWQRFFLTNYWDDPARGTLPLAWSVGPTVYDLMPDIMDYYYRRAGANDSFVCAVSGVGYCFGDRYAEPYRGAEGVRDGFLDLTAEYMRRMGLRCVWTSSTTGQRLSRYAERLSDLTALLPDYGRLPGTTPANANELVHGVPVFHALTTFDPKGGPEEARELLVREIRQFTPPERPAFMHVFVQCYPCSPSLLKQVLVEVGPDYVPVLPEQLADLYKAARG